MSSPGDTLLISSDSHVIEPSDLWLTRLPQAFRDRVPRFPKAAGPFQAHPGGWDPNARLGEMATDGVSAEVLYPTLALNLFHLEDAALQEACFTIYNDWIADYCKVSPERLVGIGIISTYDISHAVLALERCKCLGLRGAIIWQLPPEQFAFYTPHHERFWAAAAELQMPISLHILTGHDWSRRVSTETLTGKSFSADEKLKLGEYALRGLVNYKLLSAFHSLHDLILSGVLERHPRLQLVLVENEIGWIPFVLNQWDKYVGRNLRHYAPLTQLPSAYFLRQGHATFFNDQVGAHLLSWWGTDNCMWSNDFPHPNSTWPNSRQVVARDLGPLPPSARENLAWRNVVKLYQLAVPAALATTS